MGATVRGTVASRERKILPPQPKTYESDYFTGKQSPNNGKPDQYMIEGHHEGIVDKK